MFNFAVYEGFFLLLTDWLDFVQFQCSFRAVSLGFSWFFKKKFWRSFRAVSEQFQSNFSAVSVQFIGVLQVFVLQGFLSSLGAIPVQFHWSLKVFFFRDFGAVTEQFRYSFSAISLKFYRFSFFFCGIRSSFGAVSEQFQCNWLEFHRFCFCRDFRAVV